MRASLLRLAALACLVAPGCATEPLRFAALSSAPVPTIGYPSEGSRRVPGVTATVRSHMILWMPTNTRTPTLEDAVARVLQRGGGDLVVDAEVTHWWFVVPFLYGQEGWSVTGDVIRSPSDPRAAQPPKRGD